MRYLFTLFLDWGVTSLSFKICEMFKSLYFGLFFRFGGSLIWVERYFLLGHVLMKCSYDFNEFIKIIWYSWRNFSPKLLFRKKKFTNYIIQWFWYFPFRLINIFNFIDNIRRFILKFVKPNQIEIWSVLWGFLSIWFPDFEFWCSFLKILKESSVVFISVILHFPVIKTLYQSLLLLSFSSFSCWSKVSRPSCFFESYLQHPHRKW